MKDLHDRRMPLRCMLLLSFFLCLLPCQAPAEIIRLETDTGLIATAEYLKGETGLPAVLILHGFLQTREFSTVRRLADALHGEGYSVLTPTLTLGINARREPLSCEAIHTHSMEQDVAELAGWVDWLARNSGTRIVLIGHSAGNLQITAYLHRQAPPTPLSQAILISLIPYGHAPLNKETPEQRQQARQAQRLHPETLQEYSLVYCDRYPSTPAGYLSYVDWDQTASLAAIREIALPITVIIGSEDKRIDPLWRDRLKTLPIRLIEIEQANHFFDQHTEFELLEAVESVLNGPHSPASQ